MKKSHLIPAAALVIGTLGIGTGVVLSGGRPLTAVLNGAEEVPGPGDPDGTGSFEVRVNAGQEEICYTLAVEGIEPATAAHIHDGAAGVMGGVLVPLDPPTDGSSTGCIHVDRDLANELIQHPENYYVNVHNGTYPGGAIRGQLAKGFEDEEASKDPED